MNVEIEDLRALLTRPVAFHKLLAIAGGSVGAGVFLSQLVYWSERTDDPEGWIYKTFDDWWEETALSRFELDTIRTALKKRHLLQEKRAGVPAKLYYKIDWDQLRAALPEAVQKHRQGGRKRDRTGQYPTKVPPKGASTAPAAKSAVIPQTGFGSTEDKTSLLPKTGPGDTEGKSAVIPQATLLGQRVLTETTAKSTTTTLSACVRAKETAQPVPETVVVVPSVSGSFKAETESEAETLEDLQTEFGLNARQAGEVCVFAKRQGLAYVEQKAELTRAEPRKNAAVVFLRALREDWKSPVKIAKKPKQPKPEPSKEEVPATVQDYSAQWQYWQQATPAQREELLSRDPVLRHTTPKGGEKPRLAFLARLSTLTQASEAAA